MTARPSLEIELPASYGAEREYATRVVVDTFLGYRPLVRETGTDRVSIRLAGERERLVVDDGLFATPPHGWLAPSSLPRDRVPYRTVGRELPGAVLVDDRLPVLYGDGCGRPLLERESGTGAATLHLDVFGAAFFVLTRYEEWVANRHADEHGRFPAQASLAVRAGFLQRPIANEYAEVLRAALRVLWPRLPDLRRPAGMWLTHDVDWPLVTLRRRAGEVLRSVAADVVARRSADLARRRLAGWLRARRGDFRSDPGDTFDDLMSVADEAGLRATFTFLADGTAALDGRYRLSDPWIRRLMLRIAGRGHELGFHASYDSYDDPQRIAEEFGTLRGEAAALGIEQPVWRGRQHFLRWRNPLTWRAWSDAGLDVDSTVYFAESPGFRTGSCHAYPVFDLGRRRELPLVELPLTLMDVSATRYGRLGDERTREVAAELGRACRRLGGTFVLLWHNDAVMTEPSLRLYRDVVAAAAGGSS
jgi:uncharacterized protein DUF7033